MSWFVCSKKLLVVLPTPFHRSCLTVCFGILGFRIRCVRTNSLGLELFRETLWSSSVFVACVAALFATRPVFGWCLVQLPPRFRVVSSPAATPPRVANFVSKRLTRLRGGPASGVPIGPYGRSRRRGALFVIEERF